MTQSKIERAASAHAKDLLDMCDSKNWVEMSGEDYKRTIKNTFLAGAEHVLKWAKEKWSSDPEDSTPYYLDELEKLFTEHE